MRITRTLGAGIAALAIAAIPIATMGATAAHAGPPPPGTMEHWYQNSNGYEVNQYGNGFYYENASGNGESFDITYTSSGGYGYGSPYWCIYQSSEPAGDNNGQVGEQSNGVCGEYEQWWFQCGANDTVTVENIAVAYNDGASGLNNNQSTYPGAYVTVGSYVTGYGYKIIVGGVGVWLIGGECGD